MAQGLVREAEGYNSGEWGYPEFTDEGVRCGNHWRELRIRHENVAAVRACYAIAEEQAAEQRAEIFAEAGMSWVAGGGAVEDASYYASVIAGGGTWDGGVSGMEFSGKLCDHGLSLELCEGPQHYPMDI